MTSKRGIRRAVGIIVATIAAVGVIPPSVPGAPAVTAANPDLGAGGEFHPTVSERVYDSRNDIGGSPGKRTAGAEVHVEVLGKAGVPADPAQVLAVVVNVTLVEPTHGGFAEAYPTGFRAANPTSLVNFTQGATVPNMAVLGVGDFGAITILPQMPGVAGGQVHVLVDVFGWISKSDYVDSEDDGSRLIEVPPTRVKDTRVTGAVGAGESVSMPVRGVAGIPADPSVTGVVVNVTAINDLPGSVNTFVSATAEPVPAGEVPSTSTTNVQAGLIKANLAIVPVGPDGNIHFYNSVGEVHLALDVFGYMQKGHDALTYDGRIIPLESPFRVWDTRQIIFGNVPLGFGSQENWSLLCFAASVTLDDGPDPDTEPDPVGKQSALLGNLTGTSYDRLRPDLPADTFLSVYPLPPAGETAPLISNINVFEGMDVPNMAMLTYGTSDDGLDGYMIQAYNQNGSLHYILDVYAIVLDDGTEIVPPSGKCDST